MRFWKVSAPSHGIQIVAVVAFLAGTASSALAVAVTLPTNAVIGAPTQTTNVDVNVGTVADLEAVAVSITYDEKIVDVLSINDVTRGILTSGCNPPVVNILDPNRVTITMPCPQPGGVNGSGMLFTIKFTGIANGSSPLTFSDFMNVPNGCQLNEGTPSCESSNGMITVGQVGPTNTATSTATATATRTATATNTPVVANTATVTNTPVGPTSTTTATGTTTATRTFTATATSTLTRTATATVTNTVTTGPSATPTVTLTASSTPTLTATVPPSSSPTTSQTPSSTLTPSPTLSPQPSSTATATLTASQTLTPSFTGTVSPTPTVTSTVSPTRTRPGAIPLIPSPLSPAGLLMVSGLGAALLWAMRRLQR